MKYEKIVKCRFSAKRTKEMHFHQEIEIIYVLDGMLEITCNENSDILHTDEFILINSNVRHEYHADEDVLLGSLLIDYTMLTEIFGGEQLFFWCNSVREKSESYEKMRYYIRQIFNYYQTVEGQGILLKNSIYYQFLYLITTDFIVRKGMSQYENLRGIRNERLNEILNYLTMNYKESITLNNLAERLYLTHTYLSKYIKQNFGMSFLKLLNNIRLEHAVSDLIYTNKTVLKVALDNGFSNQAGFNQAFRGTYHMTPAEYREKLQERYNRPAHADGSSELMEKVEQYLISNHVGKPDAVGSAVSVLEVDTEKKVPLCRNWNRMVNIGQAKELLRYDVREQIRFIKDSLKFQYLRFWNLLSEDMLISLKGQNVKYSFKRVDQILDFILQIGAKPHIELSRKYMGFFGKIEQRMLNIGEENQLILLEKNKSFLEEFIRHLTRRYGIREVETWYFEMEWNSVIQEKISIQTYFRVFDTLAGIFRTYAPGVKIGGAGFSLNDVGRELPEVLEQWMEQKQKPDFLSIYSYPYIMNEDLMEAGRNPYSPDESYLLHSVQRVKEILREKGITVPEILVTEWNSTLSNRNCLNDGVYKSSYIVKNLIENYGKADSIGYWVATDIFSEDIESTGLLFGGSGLISREGIRKPAFFAYEHMNHLESFFLGKNCNAIVSCNEKGLYYVCCHNFKHVNFRYYSCNESEIQVENQRRLFEDNESIQISFRLRNVNNGMYQIKTFSVNQENGNIQSEWKKLDYFNDLSVQEIEYLKRICQPKITIHKVKAVDHVLIVETRLSAQEIQGIVIAEL